MEWPQAELVGECPISVAINLRQPKSWATLDGFSGGVATSGGVSFGDARVEACPTPGGSADCTGWAQPVQQLPNVGTASCGGAIGSDCVPWARPLHKPPDSGTGTRSPRAMAILSNASMEPSRLPSPVRRGRTTSAPPSADKLNSQEYLLLDRVLCHAWRRCQAQRCLSRAKQKLGSELPQPGECRLGRRSSPQHRFRRRRQRPTRHSLLQQPERLLQGLPPALLAKTALTRCCQLGH